MPDTDRSTAALDDAAAKAVENQEVEETQTDEPEEHEVAAEESAETVEDRIYHKLKSDYGRKDAALHKRLDGFDQTIRNFQSYLESNTRRQEEDQIDPNEPLTLADYDRLTRQREEMKQRELQQYDDKFRTTVGRLGPDLTQDQWDGVVEEMNKLKIDTSIAPEVAAKLNFNEAQAIYFRKQSAKPIERQNPLKGEDKPTSVIQSQKTVVEETAAPKLDSAAQSYLKMVAREDGEEKAAKLRKSLK